MFKGLYKTVAASLLSLGLNTGVFAQETTESDSTKVDRIEVDGLMRINTKLSAQAVEQSLPNLVVNAEKGDWKVSGAIQIENIAPAQGLFAEHDTRLFFLNATYSGLKKYGATVKVGLFAPDELTQFPLVKGFTHVVADDNYAIYGGIVGAKIDHEFPVSDKVNITVNGGIGTKPSWLERFGSPAGVVAFSGVGVKHRFSDAVSLRAGYEAVNMFDDVNPQGADYYAYGGLDIKRDDVDVGIFVEKVNGQRCVGSACTPTDKYSLTLNAMMHIKPKTDWQVAAGLTNGQGLFETSLYHAFNEGWRGTFGIGHNFETEENVVRVGLVKDF